MTELENSIKTIHEEILKNRSEIKSCIEASEARLLLKIELLKKTVSNLEKENCMLKEEVEILKRKQNKKNIVIFGLNKKQEDIQADNLCKDLKDLIDVELKSSDINDVYQLGKTNNCPIKIEFSTYLKKKEVLENCKKLKGKKITITHDLTLTQRSEIKILKKHLFMAKQEQKYKECYIKGNKLIVDGTSYGVEELEKEIILDNKPNSEPSTPTIKSIEGIFGGKQKDSSTPKVPVVKKPVQLIKSQKPRTRSENKLQ